MAPLLTKEHGRIDFTRPAHLVSGHIRAVDPWPGAFTYASNRPEELIKLFQPTCVAQTGNPGEVLGLSAQGLLVACGEGAVAIAELQAAGRKRLKAQDFVAGFPVPVGTVLGGGTINPLLSHDE